MVGRTLGSYQIVEKLGEGGMGEVWRARDTRLGRFVAVKVLPSDLVRDADRRQRFEAEARAVGALNHPNIVAVYDVGTESEQIYMVAELVEGESLRSLIRRGPLNPRRLADLAAQIADGLAAAHGVGIVHRDLKPENIMVTRDGRAKILDFGLAKQVPKSVADETATAVLSEPGIVMGTVGYMSPEQVRGETVDPRSDIFSFGCILYELATGKRAFQAGSAAEVLSAILKDDPPPVENPTLEAIIRRCLEKQPDQRFQSAADLAFALRAISTSTGSQPAVAPPKTASRSKWLWPVAMAAVAILLVAGGYLLGGRTAIQNPPKFERLTFRQGQISTARFVGDAVIYTANWEGGPGRTYLVTPGNPESRDLMMPENSRLLSAAASGDLALIVGPFDPDGSGTLARSSVTGGQARELLEHVYAGDWTADGKSAALSRRVNGKWRLEYPEGTVLLESEWPAFGLRISPDGERVAFCEYDQGSRVGITTVDRAGKRQHLGIVSSQIAMAESARLFWSSDGKEIWFRSLDWNDPGTIYGLSLTGKRRIVARMPGQINLEDLSRTGQALITTDDKRVGILGAAPGETAERDLSVLDATYVSSISRDGSMILTNAVGASGGPHGSIYLRRTDGAPPVRLGEGNGYAFSPDGKWLAAFTTPDGVTRKFVLLPTGTGEEKEVTVPGLVKGSGMLAGWLPGEQNYLVEGALPGKKAWQIFVWDAVAGTVRPVSPEGMSGEGLPMLSPDAKRYYHLGPDAAWHVYSIADGKQSDMRGITPHDIPAGWYMDNQSIFVRTHADTNKMMRVAILNIDTGERKPWKEIHPSRPVDEVSNLCVTPDGHAYAYNYRQATSDLYLVKGLK